MARVLYRNENLKRVLETVFGGGAALGNLFIFIVFSVLPPPQHGLSSDTMALITSHYDEMCSLRIKWP